MDKLKRMSRRRKEAHAEFLSLESKVYQAFLDMERVAFAEGSLT